MLCRWMPGDRRVRGEAGVGLVVAGGASAGAFNMEKISASRAQSDERSTTLQSLVDRKSLAVPAVAAEHWGLGRRAKEAGGAVVSDGGKKETCWQGRLTLTT